MAGRQRAPISGFLPGPSRLRTGYMLNFDPDASMGNHPFLKGGGALGVLIAAHDWSSTSLGPIEGWPQALKTTLAIVLRSPVAIVILWGTEGIMIYNDAYSRFAGERHPQLLGSKVREGWPEVADFNDNIMRVVLGRGETITYKDRELVLNRRGKLEQGWMDLDYSPVLDESGEPGGVMAIVVETTEKVRAELALRHSEERLQRAQEAGGVGVFTIEITDNILQGTPEFYRVFGLEPSGVVSGSVIEALVHPDDKLLISSAEGRKSGEAPVAAEYRIRRADTGAVRVISRRAEYERDEAGVPLRMAGVVQDITERKLAQRALEESEAQFRTFAQAMPNQVWTAPADGQLDWFNDRVIAYSGLPANQLMGSGWARMVHADDLEQAQAKWVACLSSGDTYDTEFRLRRADGTFRWHLARALPLRSSDGTIARWIGTNTDIHEQKLAETENARDKARMWTMSQDLLLVCDFEGVIRAVNPSAGRMLGWDEEELVGQSLISFIHPDDQAASAAEVKKLSLGATTLSFENRYRSKDEGYRLLNWTAVPDDGRIHGVGRDITVEREAARDQERIWTLSPVLKVVASVDGCIGKVNPAWTSTLGWSSEDTERRPVKDFFGDDTSDIEATFRKLEEGAAISDNEFAMAAKDGTSHRISWTFVPEGGTIFGFGRDVTEQRRAEDALRQSQKMEAVGQLTGGIAHDFNNLLTAISGSLELLGVRIEQGKLGGVERYISAAQESARRAASLTQRLLAFSRRQTLDPKPTDVNKLLAGVEDLLRRTVGPAIELEVVGAGGLWTVKIDPPQLENAILNLIINARDAMPDGGRITIETANKWLDDRSARERELPPGQYISLCVTDTGTGMPPDVIAQAFDPFFTTKPLGQGTGLGLSMIHGFVRQSGGQVRVYSELGTGTTMCLYFPRYLGDSAEQSLGASALHQPDTGHGERILVVDDEPLVRLFMVEVLEDAGYVILEAADGPSSLKILQSDTRIDLLVTDVGLPGGMNGRQMADAARAWRPDLKVLFVTGYAENAVVGNGHLDVGMQVIGKPFDVAAFGQKVRSLLDS
jgi:PAS domain S-box-containing protein